MSLENDIVPSSMKAVKVIPIYKSKNKQLFCNIFENIKLCIDNHGVK
jgi:hypothetical protein